jgi:hypothetical protein
MGAWFGDIGGSGGRQFSGAAALGGWMDDKYK